MLFHTEIEKIQARAENIKLYRQLTGLKSIPKDRGYWTLCNIQENKTGSEILQVERAGLATKQQFHGVDKNVVLVTQNKLWHPTAHWYAGDWLEVIEGCENFNPALIYLDTQSFVNMHIAAEMVSRTMMMCPPQTLLLANVMTNDPMRLKKRLTIEKDELLAAIARKVPSMELERWMKEIRNFHYNQTGRTDMQTYALYKS